jgi:hypothetical protein
MPVLWRRGGRLQDPGEHAGRDGDASGLEMESPREMDRRLLRKLVRVPRRHEPHGNDLRDGVGSNRNVEPESRGGESMIIRTLAVIGLIAIIIALDLIIAMIYVAVEERIKRRKRHDN